MRRFLFVAGLAALFIVVLGAAGFSYLVYEGNSLDSQSQAFVNTAIPAIASNWDEGALLVRVAPGFKENTNFVQLRSAFETLRRLGPMVGYSGAKG